MNRLLRYALSRGGAIAALAVAALLGSGAASAAGTAAGTTISNKATLSYKVGTVSQTNIESSPNGSTSSTGTATTFLVDNKVNVLVATTDNTFVTAIPGQADVTTTFTVSNTGNNTQDFALTTADKANGQTVVLGGNTYTDNGLAPSAACDIYVDTSAAGDGSAWTKQSTISTLAPDKSRTVKVACTFAGTAVDQDVSVVSLTATAKASGGGNLTASTTNAPDQVDIVFADGAGSDDAASSADHSARSAYKVVSSKLLVTKSVAVQCDPVRGTDTTTYALMNIPGAFVRYTIKIQNTGNASAMLTAISDVLDTNVDFDLNLIKGTSTAANASTECATAGTPTSGADKGFMVLQTERGYTALAPLYLTSTTTVDGASYTAGTRTVAVDFPTALPAGGGYLAGELKKNETVQVIYQVQIK